jgi:nucleotide-binding universal stress UspA family protein
MSLAHEKILVATDGSDESHLAIEKGMHLAQLEDAELHLVHVGFLSEWVHPDTLSSQQYERLEQEAQDLLDEEVASVEDAGGTVADAHLRMGEADSEIIELSEELDVDLIVLGTRGRDALKRVVLGSDSANVVQYAPCTVMVVRNSA